MIQFLDRNKIFWRKILKNNAQYLQKGNCSRQLIKAGISGIQKTHS